MTDVMNVAVRSETGTNQIRRLRGQGRTPAVLYGHGEENVSLSLDAAEIEAAIRQGVKMVDLRGGVAEKALIRAVQWDAFGAQVLHVDLNRVSVGEKVVVTVPIELRGEAPGANVGGVVEQQVHALEIECPAGDIPEKISLSINALELDQSISVGELDVPASVRVLIPAESVVVSCQAPLVTEEEEEGEAPGTSEPEVIGRKDEDEEEDAG